MRRKIYQYEPMIREILFLIALVIGLAVKGVAVE